MRRTVLVDGMSRRAAVREFGIAGETIRKMLEYSLPPGYLRQKPVRRPKRGRGRASFTRSFETTSNVRGTNGPGTTSAFEQKDALLANSSCSQSSPRQLSCSGSFCARLGCPASPALLAYTRNDPDLRNSKCSVNSNQRRISIMNCPHCGSENIRPSEKARPGDALERLRGNSAFRCRTCRKRFYAPQSRLQGLRQMIESVRKTPFTQSSLSTRRRMRQRLKVFAVFAAAFVFFWLFLYFITAEGNTSQPPADSPSSFRGTDSGAGFANG